MLSRITALVALILVAGLVPGLAQTLLVAAASDLASVEEPLFKAFTAETGDRVRFVFQSSGMLARQIQNGAPYDVYLSANEMYVRELAASGDLVADSVRVYAVGRLGLWSGKGNIQRLEQLLDPAVRHVAIANPAHAPYGVAAREALMHQGLWEKIQEKLVLGENVRQTWQYGESGNADAVITSWTLVLNQGGVQLPAEWHQPIRQAGGLLRSSRNQAAARRFLAFLVSDNGQRILAAHGLQRAP